jgi:hypothetical protein
MARVEVPAAVYGHLNYIGGDLHREHPFPRPHFPPIATQQFQQLGGQLDIAMLMAFTQLDADHHPLAVNVVWAQMHGFTDDTTRTKFSFRAV